jgi:glycosyl hydrolase family 26
MRAARRNVPLRPVTSVDGQAAEGGPAGEIARAARPRHASRPAGRHLVRWAIAIAMAAVLAGLGWAAVAVVFPGPLNTRTTCVYTAGSRSALDSFDRLTGTQVNCVLLYNDANTTWSEWDRPWFADSAGGDAGWRQWLSADRAARRVVISQEMVPDGVPPNWRETGAAGGYDRYARQLAANLVAAGMGNAVIRLGHEMNGTWYHDALGHDPAQYGDWAVYWARIVRTMRSVPGARFLFDWNVNAGYRNIPLDQYYPGDGVVDVIGVDVYDSGMPGNPSDPAARWARLDHEPGGLAQIVAFARRHGKPLSVPEWGVVSAADGGLGDNPAYVAGIAGTIGGNNVVYQAYFDRAVGGVMPLKDAPRSQRLWVKYFGARGTLHGRSW